MIKIQLAPHHWNKQKYGYRIATQDILSNHPIHYLEPYRTFFVEDHLDNLTMDRKIQPIGELIYDGFGWLANKYRHVECHATNRGYYLKISGLGNYLISQDGMTILQLGRPQRARDDQIEEAVIGPALILALALHSVWCLHASAVNISGKLIAFTGSSGYGKSTLARYMHSEESNPSQRFIDDIFPIQLSSKGVDACLHYPQLKLSRAEQPDQPTFETLPLTAIYILAKQPPGSSEIHKINLSPAQAALNLIEHTVAARLFNHSLLTQHFHFASEAALRIPVRKLLYPRQYELLDLVRSNLLADLG